MLAPGTNTAVNSAATLVAKTVEIAFTGLQYAHQQWKLKQNDQLVQAIEEINHIYEKHLKNISINLPIVGRQCLPPIFIRKDLASPKTDNILEDSNNNKKNKKDKKRASISNGSDAESKIAIVEFESFELSKKLLEKIGEAKPINSQSSTMKTFVNQIKSALELLIAYHAKRQKSGKAANDTTSNVICYLMLMLSEHCLQFSGTNEEINYLEKMARFINGFASLRKKKDSERFIELSKVYAKIKVAQGNLQNYVGSHYADKLNRDLMSQTEEAIITLIRATCKLISPQAVWDYIDNAQLQDIAQGVLQQGLNSSTFQRNDPPVLLPDKDKDVFSNWLQICAKDFLFITNEQVPDNQYQGFQISTEKFPFKQCHHLDKPTYKFMSDFFSHNLFFLEYTLRKQKKIEVENPKGIQSLADLKLAQKQHDLNVNMLTMNQLFMTIHYLTTLAFFSRSVDKCMGEKPKYLGRSENSRYIFDIGNETANNMLSRMATNTYRRFLSILNTTNDEMLFSPRQDLLILIQDNLGRINEEIIETVSSLVKENRKASVYAPKAVPLNIEQNPLLKLFKSIKEGLSLKVLPDTTMKHTTPNHKRNHSAEESPDCSSLTRSRRASRSINLNSSLRSEDPTEDPYALYGNNTTTNTPRIIKTKMQTKDLGKAPKVQAQHALEKYKSLIPAKEFAVYQCIIKHMSTLHAHASKMQQEEDTERQNKANETFEFIDNIFIKTTEQIKSKATIHNQLEPEFQRRLFETFSSNILSDIQKKKTSFLDEPKTHSLLYTILADIGKSIAKVFTMGNTDLWLFQTTSRHTLEKARKEIRQLHHKARRSMQNGGN